MKFKKVAAAVLSACLSVAGLGVASLVTAVPAQAATEITSGEWIYGKSYGQRSPFCYGRESKNDRVRLQFRNQAGKWTTVATAKPNWFKKKRQRCPKKYPFELTWRFTVSELGQPVGKDRYVLQVREPVARGYESEAFTKTVWSSREAFDKKVACDIENIFAQDLGYNADGSGPKDC